MDPYRYLIQPALSKGLPVSPVGELDPEAVSAAGWNVLDDELPDVAAGLVEEGAVRENGLVHMPPTMGEPVGMFGANSALCEITHIDADAHRAAWKTAGSPAWLLRTERWQALSVDEATGKTRYETVEVFGGVLAYITSYFFGDKLREAFRAFADTLKARAERS